MNTITVSQRGSGFVAAILTRECRMVEITDLHLTASDARAAAETLLASPTWRAAFELAWRGRYTLNP